MPQRKRSIESLAPRRSTEGRPDIQQTAGQRVNRVTALFGAEIEHRRHMTCRASRLGIGKQRFAQARLAHAGIGADQRDSAESARSSVLEQGGKTRSLAFAPQQRLLYCVGCAKRGNPKGRSAVSETANGNSAERLEIGKRRKRALHIVRDDGFTAASELR